MMPYYYVTDAETGILIPAIVRKATKTDFKKTVSDHWQTNWQSAFIQSDELEKYALAIEGTKELVGLGAYRDMPEGVLVYVEYIESAPCSNPNMTDRKAYLGIGAALLAFGIQLSIDYGYGGTIFLKAKTSELREYYIRSFGAIPFSRRDPFLLLIDGEASQALFSQYLKE